MNERNLVSPFALTGKKELRTLVENRKAYTLNHCELNIYETYERSELVPLTFSDLVITSMLRGKKVMHLFDKPGFDYLPGETVIVPPNVTMTIDFPEASEINPSQCTALAINQQEIRNTLDFLNENYPRANNDLWQLNYQQFHFFNNYELAQLINKLIGISTGDNLAKDVLANLTLKELLIRIMQMQNLHEMKDNLTQMSTSNRFAYILQYIKAHLTEKLNIDALSQMAYMSKASFFRTFKHELGVSPVDYIIKERIQLAKQFMQNPYCSIADACFKAGFNNQHYFSRVFRKMVGTTPSLYKAGIVKTIN
ncbi:AraC family transcriptional regulator [Mucilaginibacter lappiensis]|uniref:AraC-like DNA-binding protein n=1 Tax=Mucilaginibacter lappiensis TaxID=354630 RepID=A0A1N7FJ74_9SPHI|nr:AraC family transcriptional regulator [Mucilaginibacter lappiensis]MBB6112448.1 AraC-like DNA-binding protein [Mucilaginibacter lappiensis]MBB6127027.1 AraC-like DNA-binding protein [Mucilaginibacter lappiensis]SIS00276.1 transcriptional regulator, AraC family [Mucilaginibacter lappiensis]